VGRFCVLTWGGRLRYLYLYLHEVVAPASTKRSTFARDEGARLPGALSFTGTRGAARCSVVNNASRGSKCACRVVVGGVSFSGCLWL
jgi:hypothetical protein